MPGGDDFGSRPIDMHIKGFEALGATIDVRHGDLEATADRLRGARIALDYPSVGATENLLMAAVLAKGTTVIDNAAREPEIADLVDAARRHGCAHRRRGHVDAHHRGCRRAAADRARRDPRSRRGRHVRDGVSVSPAVA